MPTLIIGGGIVGLATALALTHRGRGPVVVLEAENRLAAHQTGHNSGVIHSGLYYRPGSLKARLCVQGREQMYAFCDEHNVPYEKCGKVVVATSVAEMDALIKLEKRGQANGLRGLRRLDGHELREREPHVAGVGGLLVPDTGIVDFASVAHAYAKVLQQHGGEIRLNTTVTGCVVDGHDAVVRTTRGELRGDLVVNCGGLCADRVARSSGAEHDVTLVPFRGEYWELSESARSLVRNLIYPVPDPRFPFLGVHFTRMIQGGIEIGPNAVLALARHGYAWSNVSFGDLFEMLRSGAFRRMFRRYWKAGVREMHRSLSKRAFLKSAQTLIPELTAADLKPARSGVRAQAVAPDGSLIDDFQIVRQGPIIHVLNAPSPAATASLSIGQYVAELAAPEGE